MNDNTREHLLSACCCISLEPPVAYVNHTKAHVARLPTSVWPEDRRQGAQRGRESKAGRRYHDGRTDDLDLEKRNGSRPMGLTLWSQYRNLYTLHWFHQIEALIELDYSGGVSS